MQPTLLLIKTMQTVLLLMPLEKYLWAIWIFRAMENTYSRSI